MSWSTTGVMPWAIVYRPYPIHNGLQALKIIITLVCILLLLSVNRALARALRFWHTSTRGIGFLAYSLDLPVGLYRKIVQIKLVWLGVWWLHDFFLDCPCSLNLYKVFLRYWRTKKMFILINQRNNYIFIAFQIIKKHGSKPHFEFSHAYLLVQKNRLCLHYF